MVCQLNVSRFRSSWMEFKKPFIMTSNRGQLMEPLLLDLIWDRERERENPRMQCNQNETERHSLKEVPRIWSSYLMPSGRLVETFWMDIGYPLRAHLNTFLMNLIHTMAWRKTVRYGILRWATRGHFVLEKAHLIFSAQRKRPQKCAL